MIGRRKLSRVLRAGVRGRSYAALLNMASKVEQPARWFYRYVTGTGTYPCSARVRTPTGPVSIKMWSHHDLLTLNEIFCRNDYPVTGHEEVIVDFGSNVGISGLYFLTHAPSSVIYLFEPVPANVKKLKEQLSAFSGRYTLFPIAVSNFDGAAEFGVEETGRYGGIGKSLSGAVTVECRSANTVLSEILERHRKIDILKVDIEGSEKDVIEDVEGTIAKRVHRIYAETKLMRNPLSETHAWKQTRNLASFVSLSS